MNKPKFRAWDKERGMMKCHGLFQGCTIAQLYNDDYQNYMRFLDEIILMQYTGLKDKNGNQYCQDDLVRYQGKIYRLIKGSYAFELVGFNESYQDNPSDFFSEGAYLTAEIVGNLYENPELLSGVE